MRFKEHRSRLAAAAIFVLHFISAECHGQLSAMFKSGLNIGSINQDYWLVTDSIKYDKALVRGILGVNVQYLFADKWIVRQGAMFQIKGQGTSHPNFRSAFATESPDILRFMSFPASVNRKLFSGFCIGVGIQPSLYLSGSENFSAKEDWHGWVWSVVANASYQLKEVLEFGVEYDHDLTLYYCPDCDIRFFTWRFYAAYHFRD